MTGWSRPAVVGPFGAAAVLMVTMGARNTLGLFVSPINSSTGLGVVTISFALAIAQFVWGAVQPLAGALADRHGPRRGLVWGLVVLAAGTALTPFMSTGVGLVLVLGFLTAIGSGSASFSVLLGAAAQRLPPQARGTASGIINAGGSFGQFVFAPITQKLIQGVGWMGAMCALAVMTLAPLPLGGLVAKRCWAPAKAAAGEGVWNAVQNAMGNGSYLLLHAGFFTCGFH